MQEIKFNYSHSFIIEVVHFISSCKAIMLIKNFNFVQNALGLTVLHIAIRFSLSDAKCVLQCVDGDVSSVCHNTCETVLLQISTALLTVLLNWKCQLNCICRVTKVSRKLMKIPLTQTHKRINSAEILLL